MKLDECERNKKRESEVLEREKYKNRDSWVTMNKRLEKEIKMQWDKQESRLIPLSPPMGGSLFTCV